MNRTKLLETLVTVSRLDDDGEVLGWIAKALLADGHSVEELLDLLKAASELIDDSEGAHEAILNVMDRLNGWCGPFARID